MTAKVWGAWRRRRAKPLRKVTKWTEPYETKQKGYRKPVTVTTAIIAGHPDRFTLYQSRTIPTMWTLYDRDGVFHFLYAQPTWAAAQAVTEARIVEILATPRA